MISSSQDLINNFTIKPKNNSLNTWSESGLIFQVL